MMMLSRPQKNCIITAEASTTYEFVWHNEGNVCPSRMLKMAVQQGRSERKPKRTLGTLRIWR